ncbi:MAG TPA: response regulator [Thermoanaerobaculia bacterium]|nr:response regulator [Thermoanaerobaculia bacterium]
MIGEVYRFRAVAYVVRRLATVPGSVLIVDDDPSVVEALRAVLPADVEVATAASADGAMALLDSRAFCGMVLDVVLEQGNGFDVLRHMERHQMTVPTVVVSTKLPAYLREMLDEKQVKMLFPKPIEPRLLAAVVLGLCGVA